MKNLGILCFSIFVLAVLIFPTQALSAASNPVPKTAEEKLVALNKLAPVERKTKLEDEAAREGKVIMYGAYSLGEAEPLFKTFMEKYPKVKVEYFRASTAPLLDKILSEASVGKLGADCANIGLEVLYEIDKLIIPYKTPEAAAYGKQFVDANYRWIALYQDPKPITYNTKRVSKAEAPKNWEDLALPRWKGRLGIPMADGPEWVNITLKVMGQEKGRDYLKRMAALGIRLEKSNSGLAQMVAAGDLDVAFFVNNAAVEIAKGQGAPIVAVPTDPLVTSPQVLVVFKDVVHPYATALLVDWLTSKEGQERIRDINPRFSARRDVTVPASFAGRKFLVIGAEQVSKERMDEANKLFEEWFVKRR